MYGQFSGGVAPLALVTPLALQGDLTNQPVVGIAAAMAIIFGRVAVALLLRSRRLAARRLLLLRVESDSLR